MGRAHHDALRRAATATPTHIVGLLDQLALHNAEFFHLPGRGGLGAEHTLLGQAAAIDRIIALRQHGRPLCCVGRTLWRGSMGRRGGMRRRWRKALRARGIRRSLRMRGCGRKVLPCRRAGLAIQGRSGIGPAKGCRPRLIVPRLRLPGIGRILARLAGAGIGRARVWTKTTTLRGIAEGRIGLPRVMPRKTGRGDNPPLPRGLRRKRCARLGILAIGRALTTGKPRRILPRIARLPHSRANTRKLRARAKRRRHLPPRSTRRGPSAGHLATRHLATGHWRAGSGISRRVQHVGQHIARRGRWHELLPVEGPHGALDRRGAFGCGAGKGLCGKLLGIVHRFSLTPPCCAGRIPSPTAKRTGHPKPPERPQNVEPCAPAPSAWPPSPPRK